MRLPGQISAAIEVLTDMETRHRPASMALRDWGLAHRFAGSSDRAVIGNIVYDAQRRARSLAWRMGADTPRALALGVIGMTWGHDISELADILADDKFGPGALTADERKVLEVPPEIGCAPDAVRADVPDWCVASLEAALGGGWVAEGQALAGRPPLDLRVNTLKADRDKVLAQLKRTSAAVCPLSPVGIRIPSTDGKRRHPNIQSDETWRRGRLEVQDEGSQLCALLTGVLPGNQVLDLCAGAGGKTLALAAMMENRGQIYAHDADRNRLAGIYDRLQRAGVRNVQVRPPDADALAGLEDRMDLVLVDTPCSGSGVWRRHPDSKWRLSEKSLMARVSEQQVILDQAARYVRPGGHLVYVTCSVLAEENQDRISGFLKENAGFRPAELPGVSAFSLGSDQDNGNSALQLTPARTATDGFFVACLQRQ